MVDSLIIPNLETPDHRWLSVCGKCKQEIAAVGTKHQVAVFRYGTPADAESPFVRVMVGNKGEHVHVDVHGPECWGKRQPKEHGDKDRLLELLSQCFGNDVDATICAGFVIAKEELPENGLIRASMFSTTVGKTSVEQTGAAFSFSGGPIGEIEWKFDDEKRTLVEVSIKMRAVLGLAADYLVTASTRINEAFLTAVLGRQREE
ncbi:MAG: hypothetical protein V3T84_17495 [Phycisphaerales bacterium]